MFNKTFLLGNLGRDPEVRSLQGGKPVATFPMATSRKWRDRDGNQQEQTEWHQIVCFGRLAEIAGQYLTKGKQVFVEGRIQTRTWDDRNTGEKRYKTEIVADNFQMLGGGRRSDDHGSDDHDDSYGGSGSPPYGNDPAPEDDDIPF